jgi:hypothetical protein
MKYLLYIFIISVSSFFLVDEPSAEVRESMLSCLVNSPSLSDDKDRYAIYIHITPHKYSMIDRNSEIRDKTEGDIRLVFFEYVYDPVETLDKYGTIKETYDLKEYHTNIQDEQISIDRETLIMTRNSAKFQCDILSTKNTFEDHVQLHLNKLQSKKDIEQEQQLRKNKI